MDQLVGYYVNVLMMKHDDVDNKGHVNFNVEHIMYERLKLMVVLDFKLHVDQMISDLEII